MTGNSIAKQFQAGQGSTNGYSFFADGAQDTGMFSDSDGDLYFMNNGTKWYAAHADHIHGNDYLRMIGDVSDLNDSYTQGIYTFNTTSKNGPCEYGTLIILNNGITGTGYSHWIQQIAYGTSSCIYKRQYINTIGWTEWIQVAYTQDTVKAANKIASLGQLTSTSSILADTGITMSESYGEAANYPISYGNVITAIGNIARGAGQLFCGWSDSASDDNPINSSLYYRSKRDNIDKWSDWDRLAFMKDVTAANTGGIVAQSLGTNGYVKFANGLILQWGFIQTVNDSITLPLQFSNSDYALCALIHSKLTILDSWDEKSFKVSGYYINSNGTIEYSNSTGTTKYIAIGI